MLSHLFLLVAIAVPKMVHQIVSQIMVRSPATNATHACVYMRQHNASFTTCKARRDNSSNGHAGTDGRTSTCKARRDNSSNGHAGTDGRTLTCKVRRDNSSIGHAGTDGRTTTWLKFKSANTV